MRECDVLWTGMHAWIIVAAPEILLLLGEKKKKVDVLAEGCPRLLVILQSVPLFGWTQLTFADRAWQSLHSVVREAHTAGLPVPLLQDRIVFLNS